MEKEEQKKDNPLRIGICNLDELEEKVKAFRVMNQSALKKRYVLSREVITAPGGGVVLQKSAEIDISRAKLLRRHFGNEDSFKTFQPDEGIDLTFASKIPGEDVAIGEVTMRMTYAEAFERKAGDAYERLLLDGMRGDPTLFA